MKGRRVRLDEIPLGSLFRRWGASEFLGGCIRITDKDYCEEKDYEESKAVLKLYPKRPGTRAYRSVDALLALPREKFNALSCWNRYFAFQDRDFERADKKDFYLYPDKERV